MFLSPPIVGPAVRCLAVARPASCPTRRFAIAAPRRAPHRRSPAPLAFVERVIRIAAADVGLPETLLRAIAVRESGLDSTATSKAGAVGIMQLEPATARDYGVVDRFDARANVYAGARYFATLLHRYHDRLPLALAAYNAGPRVVDAAHGIPPYAETKAYVSTIVARVAPKT